MAFHHHHHHHHQPNPQPTATAPCCCQTPPCQYPQPPPPLPLSSSSPTTDPFLMAAIVSHLLQPQNPPNFSTINPSQTLNQRYPHQETPHFHPHSQFFSSLLQRIDALESSLHRFSPFSSSSSFSLRDAAARTIQTHFRAFLVRRSRILRQLKDLASIKSSLTLLESSLSRQGFIDFDCISRKAMNLLLKLDSIQGEDQMIRDSKRSITRRVVQFLELVDGACVKRHQVFIQKMKNMRLVKNDSRDAYDGRGFSERNVGSKCRNVGNNEKKLIANLRERVERIGRMSRAFEEEEMGNGEMEGFKHVDDEDGGIIDQITSNYRVKNGVSINKNEQRSNAKKRVCFVEDGNVIRVFDIDGDTRSTSRVIDEIEETTKGKEDEEEAQSSGEVSEDGWDQDEELLLKL